MSLTVCGKCGIPTIQSIPDQIEYVLVEKPEPNGPFGAKGISEAALVQTAPAITNAIYDACGVRSKVASDQGTGEILMRSETAVLVSHD